VSGLPVGISPLPKKTRIARSPSALVGGLYPAASAEPLPPDTPARKLLLWAHEDGELLERRLLDASEVSDAAIHSALERFHARDGAPPLRVVLNSKRLLELSRAAVGDALPCHEGETPQTDRAAAILARCLAPPQFAPSVISPGVDRDVGVEVLACFFDHAHALFERSPWNALDERFDLIRADLADLGWPHALIELLRDEDGGAGFILHRSLYDWRCAQRLRSAQLADARRPPRLELRRIPRRDVEARLRALMEEFEWLAPISLQPAPLSIDAKGDTRAPNAGELQLLAAAAVVLERLLHLEESRAETDDPRFFQATIEIQDELWRAEVEITAPPPALLGVQRHRLGDPSLRHVLQCFGCVLDEDDARSASFLEDFARFAANSYRDARGEATADESLPEPAEVMGIELLLIYLAPYLASRYLRAGGDGPRRFESTLVLCLQLVEWLAQSRLIDDDALAELRTLLARRRPELLRAAAVARAGAGPAGRTPNDASPPQPFVRALLELTRLESGRAWFRGADGRSWGPIAAPDGRWLRRVEHGWKLDLIVARNNGRLEVERLLGIYPENVSPVPPHGYILSDGTIA